MEKILVECSKEEIYPFWCLSEIKDMHNCYGEVRNVDSAIWKEYVKAEAKYREAKNKVLQQFN